MYIFNQETIVGKWNELDPLIEIHGLEVRGEDHNSAPEKPWYEQAESEGILKLFTVRLDSTFEMVGYCTMFVRVDNQREHSLYASQDAIFIKKEHRKGMTGSFFMKYIERCLYNAGVNLIYQSVTPAVDFSKLLLRQGYQKSTTIYAKHIGGNDNE